MICKKSSAKDVMIIELELELNKLRLENKSLREMNEKNTQKWAQNIDTFVEKWHEKNKEQIDIGVIDLKLFKIDIFPDKLEKHIYKKVLKIIYSFFVDTIAPEQQNDPEPYTPL
jgi:hypothetical protein